MKKIFIYISVIYSFNLFSNPSFTSFYTDFSKDCKSDPQVTEGDIPKICKGPKDFSVYITYSACFEYIQIQKKGTPTKINIPEQLIGSSDNKKLEWRLQNDQPFGIIYRGNEMEDEPVASCPRKKKKEVLFVVPFLEGTATEHKVPSGAGANEKARELLDKSKK